ncbi:MAG: AMP-binding protein [Myxococcota bacterium]
MPDGLPHATLRPSEILAGKRLLFVGCTGFVGKVALSMLLHRFRNLGKLHLLVRAPVSLSAEQRFYRKIVPSPAMDPLREAYGDGLERHLRGFVSVWEGDVTRPSLGLTEEALARLDGQIDVVINCAGLVSFNPPLDQALNVNSVGVKHLADVARRVGAAVVHVSTCFVAGERSGEIWEDEPILGAFPKQAASAQHPVGWAAAAPTGCRDIREGKSDFSPDREIEDGKRAIQEVRAHAVDQACTARFRESAAARLLEEGGSPDDERALTVATARERKIWIAEELRKLGDARSRHWGWPNAYCYSKALGEQVLVASGVRHAIVRPAIVESAVAYPVPGWNEGFTTSAPLVFASLKGHRPFPSGPGVILDVIPVDMVAAGLLAVTAATAAGEQEQVYQLGSGDSNPLTVEHTIELVGIYKRRYFRERETGNALVNRLRSRMESIPVSKERFLRETGIVGKALDGARQALDAMAPRWGAPRLGSAVDAAREKVDDLREQSKRIEQLFELFMPFVHDHAPVFRCDHIRALRARVVEEERASLSFTPESIQWRDYWIDVHIVGLEKWVFPRLEKDLEVQPRRVHAYHHLLEMFDTATRRFGTRVAMRTVGRKGRAQKHTYADLQAFATHAASVLRARGVAPGDRVLLAAEGRPEWAMAYFGILKAGAVAVPIDVKSSAEEAANLVAWSSARVAILGDEAKERFGKLPAPSLGFSELFADSPPVPLAPVHTPKPDDCASLIFTSGTTGKPKGVMLSHRNFASLLSRLSSVFDVGPRDGTLSVLPLHHTFEFTCGLLMPLSRGAEITYLEEVTPERLREALASGRVSLLIGVPALWQALERGVFTRIGESFGDAGDWAEKLARAMCDGLDSLRQSSGVNLGKLVFLPVHLRFGGRLRYLISGGSSLPADVFKAFSGLGFSLYEGYGLTEASPVLAVNRPGRKLRPGTVGEPLPGVEIVIDAPDADGVGEVIARGPNVMLGYFEDPEATAQVVRDGWLRTGDLGKLDDGGRLVIVGRKKEVIIDLSGKNVYPDEIEQIYADSPWLGELSVVGLPNDDGGERVACLAVPDYAAAADVARDELRRRLEAHFREVSAGLPQWKRIKVLHFWDGELPRTATRKVKRRFVVEQLQRFERAAKAASDGTRGRAEDRGGWILDVLASVAGKPAASIGAGTRLVEDLGFDSLMYTELLVALDHAGATAPEGDDLTSLRTVGDLAKVIGRSAPASRAAKRASGGARPGSRSEAPPLDVPEPVAAAGMALLGRLQRWSYEKLFDVRVTGRAYIPRDRGFIVAANHSSHLDMGLVKHGLGEFGRSVITLAARDYFFEGWRRTYFENFTNLLPLERQGSMKESLKLVGEAVRRGHVVLIFPEGTRSTDGVIAEFKSSVGYLALAHGVPVLPMWLGGAHASLPKGAALPRRRDLEVRIGPAIGAAALREATAGQPRSEHNRIATRLIEDGVRALARGQILALPSAGVSKEGEKHEDSGNGRNRLPGQAPAASAARGRKERRPRPQS